MRNWSLIAAHAFAAVVILALLFHQLQNRELSTQEVRRIAAQEHGDTQRLQRENAVQQDLLKGIRSNDPYVVEMLARDKLRFAAPGEVAPPMLPADGKNGQ